MSKFTTLTPTGWQRKLVGVTTERQVQSYLDQPRSYFNIDGLGEIGIGVMLLGFALIGWLQGSSPENSLWNTPWGLLLFLLPMVFGIDRGTKFIKRNITYPRTGFVAYRKSVKSVVGLLLFSGVGGAVFLLAVLRGPRLNAAAFAGMVIVPAYAYGIARTVRWKWVVVAILAIGSIGIASLPADLLASIVPAPTIRPEALREVMQFWLVEATFIGVTMLASGGVTLAHYLRHTQAPDRAAE